ncbi:hypothetical protein [Candidatus Magnetaquiglobus chichijimensis]|uniref:hypothetical protein n=1 Tax=Candidatus Magnetaquiglobus chichijimensis TaxID=3141448 RepID=UPI003B975335
MTDFNGLRFGIDRMGRMIAMGGLDNNNQTVVRLVSKDYMFDLMGEMYDLENLIYNHKS